MRACMYIKYISMCLWFVAVHKEGLPKKHVRLLRLVSLLFSFCIYSHTYGNRLWISICFGFLTVKEPAVVRGLINNVNEYTG